MSNFTVFTGEALASEASRFKGVPMTEGNVVHMLPKREVTPKLRLWSKDTVIKYCGSEYDSEVVAGARMFGTDEDLEAALSETIQYTEDQLTIMDDLGIDFAQPHYRIHDVPVFDKKGKIERIEKGILASTQVIQGDTLSTWLSTNPEWRTNGLLTGLYNRLGVYVEATKGRIFLPNIFSHDKWVVSDDDYGHVAFLTGIDPAVSFNGGEDRDRAIEQIAVMGITTPLIPKPTPTLPEAQIIPFPAR